ncbi:MAG: hypothetical protein LH465_08575 [Sphingomonas bacterium]|nr:hypothetical protein [Sphingomonas bacterium]
MNFINHLLLHRGPSYVRGARKDAVAAQKKGDPLRSRFSHLQVLKMAGSRFVRGTGWSGHEKRLATKKGDLLRSRPFHPQVLQDTHEICVKLT